MQYASSRFAWAVIDGNIIVAVHSSENPTNEEWDEYLVAGGQALDAHGSIRSLAYSQGGGPNSLQRSKTNDLFKDRPQRVAVMLNSALTRGVVTALSWFNPAIKAFNLEQLQAACDYLELTAPQSREVDAQIEQMKQAIELAASSGES